MIELPLIPNYRIEKELGQGGMAQVYLAFEEKLERPVAIKLMIPSPTQDNSITQRFIKEAKTAAILVHSNIVSIYDVGEYNGIFYMAMEYLHGGNLREKINSGISPSEAISIIKSIARALECAHKEGIVHRDIKPENILFRKDGTPVLADFGIARAVGSSTKLTKTGFSIGTPHFMSPEQARGRPLDGRSDFYSLGVVFYEMLTGKVPYDAEDSISIGIMHVQEQIPQLPIHLSQYQNIIDKMMAKDPDTRLSTGIELADFIEGKKMAPRSGHKKHETEIPKAEAKNFISTPVQLKRKPTYSRFSKTKTIKFLIICLGLLTSLLVIYLIIGSGNDKKPIKISQTDPILNYIQRYKKDIAVTSIDDKVWKLLKHPDKDNMRDVWERIRAGIIKKQNVINVTAFSDFTDNFKQKYKVLMNIGGIEQEKWINIIFIDYDFFKVLDLLFYSGRSFSKNFPNDHENVIVNENFKDKVGG